jgi:pimeloyl-ACP methyl ester carboxylesterase
MMASSTALVVMSLLVVGRVVFPLRVFKSNNHLISRSGSNSVLRAAGLSSTGTAADVISLADEDMDSTIKKITFSPFTFDASPSNMYLPDVDLIAAVASPVKKQTLLYLPGLDGSGNFSSKSFANLTDKYDCWRMAVDPSDRSSFLVVAQTVLRRLTEFDGPVVLVGESFGGLLASYVCTREGANVDKLVLINPATSFDRTAWSTIVPFIAGTGNAYPIVGATALLATAVQPQQVVNIGRDISSRIDSVDSALSQLNGMWKSV